MKIKYLILLIFFAGCTFSTTRSKSPSYKSDQNTVEANLHDIVDCERIDIMGEEENTNGDKISELTIMIVNGINLPDDKAELEELGKQITFTLIEYLVDPDEYDTFQLLFVIQKRNGAIKTDRSKGFVYKLSPPITQ